MNVYKSVIETPFFHGIFPTSEVERVSSLFVERSFPTGQIIFFQGDIGNEMYVVKSGALKIYQQDDTREVILGHQFPGETVGELEVIHHDQQRLASVATIEKSTLWILKKLDLDALIEEYPEILRRAFCIVSERLSQADQKIYYLSFLDTRSRVANLLLDLYANFGVETEEGFLINWKITQQHFASMIGLNRESVTRVLKDLQKYNIIQLEKRFIYIIDVEEIQTLAGSLQNKIEKRKWHSFHM